MVMPVREPHSNVASVLAVLLIGAVTATVLTLVTMGGDSAPEPVAVEASSSTTAEVEQAVARDSVEENPAALRATGAPGDTLEVVTEVGVTTPTDEVVVIDQSTTSSTSTVQPEQDQVTSTTQPQSSTTTQPVQDDPDDDADQPDRAADPLEPDPLQSIVAHVDFSGPSDSQLDITGSLGSQYVLLDIALGPNSTFFMMDEDDNLLGVDINTGNEAMNGTVALTNMDAATLLIVGSASEWSASFRGVETADLLSPNADRQGVGSDVMAFDVAPSVARIEASGCAANARIEMHSYGAGSIITTTLFHAGELPSSVSVSPATELISLRTECAWSMSFES